MNGNTILELRSKNRLANYEIANYQVKSLLKAFHTNKELATRLKIMQDFSYGVSYTVREIMKDEQFKSLDQEPFKKAATILHQALSQPME